MVKIFEGQHLKVKNRKNQMFEGFYYTKNKLRKPLVINTTGNYVLFEDVAKYTLIDRNLREDAQVKIDSFVDSLNPDELKKEISDNDMQALTDYAKEIVGDENNNDEEIESMFKASLTKKQMELSGGSKTEKIKKFMKEDVGFSSQTSSDFSGHYPENPHIVKMYSDDEINQKMNTFYQVDKNLNDLEEYYKIISEETDPYIVTEKVNEFVQKQQGTYADGNDLLGDYLYSIDDEYKTLEDLYNEACEHFNIKNSLKECFKEGNQVTTATFEKLEKHLNESKVYYTLCKPIQLAEAINKSFKEESMSDTFVLQNGLNDKIAPYYDEQGSLNLGNTEGGVVETEEEADQWVQDFEQELAKEFTPEDVAEIVKCTVNIIQANKESEDLDSTEPKNNDFEVEVENESEEFETEDETEGFGISEEDETSDVSFENSFEDEPGKDFE